MSSKSVLESPRREADCSRGMSLSSETYAVPGVVGALKTGFWAVERVSTGRKGARCLRGLPDMDCPRLQYF